MGGLISSWLAMFLISMETIQSKYDSRYQQAVIHKILIKTATNELLVNN